MKKGFTLVEVLAVIVILGMLIMLIVPNVNSLLKEGESALHQEQIDSVVRATKKYMVENFNSLPEGSDSTAVYVDDLISSGVIDNDKVIDPKTKKELEGCVVVSFNNDFNQYEYNYRENCNVTITFNPNGGSVSTTSKEVMIGKTFGDLPTPTRSGYTFKGWAINLFNKDTTLDGYEFNLYEIKEKSGWYVSDYIVIEPEQVYNIIGKSQGTRVNYYDNEKNGVSTGTNGNSNQIVPHGENIKYVRFNGTIEEKNTFILYSNFVTSSTNVFKSDDHTLYAVWEVAS